MPCCRSTAVGLVMLLLLPIAVPAQIAGPVVRVDAAVSFKEPIAHRVFQRDANDRAAIPIALDDEAAKSYEISRVDVDEVRPNGGRIIYAAELVDGKLVGVPAGGPYGLQVIVQKKGGGDDDGFARHIAPVFVGDLWVLAGQSNMEGYGDLVDVTPPDDRVMALGLDGRWRRAEEPLHWLVDSPDPVHSGNPEDRAQRTKEQHKSRVKGAGLGLPFAVAMVEATGVPVGLVACAHGGTSMEQWSPALKDKGGESLYGSMLGQFRRAGGRVKGVLWYQGESDAMGGKADAYPRAFADFIAAVRRDFGQPDLPFYYVQIGRFINPADPRGWNAVQEAQRRLPERIPNTAVISVLDLELDDLIHVGTQGLKRAGRRLAKVALRELFSHPDGRSTPTFESVSRGPAPGVTVRVKFRGVNRTARAGRPRLLGLRPERHIGGFSIRSAEGAALPMIYEAKVDPHAVDAVLLKLVGPIPEGAVLWYGHGLDPYCNLTDHEDMAVPAFGPIALDEVR